VPDTNIFIDYEVVFDMRLSDVWILFFSVCVLAIGILFLFYVEEPVEDERCVVVNRVAGFLYDVCYDVLSGDVLMLVESDLDYNISGFEVVFYDSGIKRYELAYEDGASYLYRLGVSGNPDVINLTLNVEDTFELPICNGSKAVEVPNCKNKKSGWDDGFVEGVVVALKEDVEDYDFAGRDACLGSWDCEWSECVSGRRSLFCSDAECGEDAVFFGDASCEDVDECVPNVTCGEWGECVVDYDLSSLTGSDDFVLEKVSSRVCYDENGCVLPVVDVRNCSRGANVFVEKVVIDGVVYLDVYDNDTQMLIAKLVRDAGDFDVYLM
jgi:hypothetical protein